MTETIITKDGKKASAVLYSGDKEPCALYVNGERQDALSYSTRSVNGSNSVQYASKYKNNLRTLSFSGNTEQAQYRGVNMFNINAPLLASPFSVEAIAKPKIENGIIYSGGYNESTLGGIDGCFLFVATDGDGDYTFSFNANCTAIESGMRFWIVGAEDVDGTTYDTGPWDYLSAPTEITGNGKYTLTVDNNGYSYIGIAFYSPTRYNIAVTNLQIEKGSVATAYEPYVGGIASPNPAYPQEIVSSGNSQVNVTLRGKNLFDISKIKPTNVSYGIQISSVGENSIVVTSHNNTSPNGYMQTSVKLSVACPNIQVGKTYRLTFNNSGKAQKIIYLPGAATQWYSGLEKTITEKMFNSVIVFYGYNFQWYPNETPELPVSVTLSDFMITEVDNTTDYEPYIEPTTVSIPPSVTLDDGTELELGFEKLGNYANKLTIDRANGKVTYLENCKTVVYDSSRYFELANINAYEGIQQFTTYVGGVKRDLNKGVAKCSHLPYDHENYSGRKISFCCLNGAITQMFPRSILVPFGFVHIDGISATDPRYINPLKAWLKDQKDKGTPFTVCAVVTPTEFDLTNTEIGQKLLEVASNTKCQTNTIEITSELPVSKTTVEYAKWSGNNDDDGEI